MGAEQEATGRIIRGHVGDLGEGADGGCHFLEGLFGGRIGNAEDADLVAGEGEIGGGAVAGARAVELGDGPGGEVDLGLGAGDGDANLGGLGFELADGGEGSGEVLGLLEGFGVFEGDGLLDVLSGEQRGDI